MVILDSRRRLVGLPLRTLPLKLLPFSTSNGPPTSALAIDSFGESVVVGYNSGLINLYELSDTVDVTKIIPTRTIRCGVSITDSS